VAELLFYLLAAGAVAFGAGVISAKMPLYSVLSLLGTFICLAGIFLLAGFQFLALTQLLVYAGAIMVLFLFVVMMLNLGAPEEEQEKHSGLSLKGGRLAIAGAAAGALAIVGIAAAGWQQSFEIEATHAEKGFDSLSELATLLFSRYVLPFEAASLLLLATMIAVISLAKRHRPDTESLGERVGWPWEKGVEQ